jgi:S-adenosylmethionine:tRNA ribosyltransferase-isomerase
LPPYIKRVKDEKADRQRYQTIYSKETGSVAAPTAGLHFTQELIKQIKALGVEVLEITLHVGLGTFAPIEQFNIDQKKLHTEAFSVLGSVIDKISEAKKNKRRIFSVGTTTTRVLESLADQILAGDSSDITDTTNIFIYPGYKFRIIDGLITNFHLPKSSLIMLVSALFGREKTLNIYKTAIKNRYRFFSYGDAMLILP